MSEVKKYGEMIIAREDMLKALRKLKIKTPEHQIKELYGAWPGKIKFASIDYINNYLIACGADGGLESDHIK